MIAVYADKRGEKYRLFVKGHAGNAGNGALVCAAVSALCGALVGFAASHGACRTVRRVLREGEVFLSCRGAIEDAFLMTVEALVALSRAHPDNMCPIACHRSDGITRWFCTGEGEKSSTPFPEEYGGNNEA